VGAGALVGEIALLNDGEKRNATVRARELCSLLVLDQRTFRELDHACLAIIKENAVYSAACSKVADAPATTTLTVAISPKLHRATLTAVTLAPTRVRSCATPLPPIPSAHVTTSPITRIAGSKASDGRGPAHLTEPHTNPR
jgi:CRP-like cAMP-binding protein